MVVLEMERCEGREFGEVGGEKAVKSIGAEAEDLECGEAGQ